ncbi:MAG: glycosyltransferase [Kiritimatiellia bacterium]|nr:glycosyltransferase [Lentisphaerota bacterium]
MNNSNLISVVIPAYNHEQYVGAAINSVLRQSYGNLELIIVDDGSTDGTPDVIGGFQDPRIRAVRQSNQDAYNAINNGMQMARGSHIAILNSDDLYHPDRLETLINICDQADAACVFTQIRPIGADGHPLAEDHPWTAWHEDNRKYYFQCRDLYTAFLRANLMVSTSNLFINAELARQVGSFAPLRYLHDYDYIFRAMLAAPGRVLYLHDRTLMDYRLHGSNTISRGAVMAREEDQALILKYMLAGLPEAWRARAETAARRLLALERELQVERYRLAHPWRWRLGRLASRLLEKLNNNG